MNHGKEQHKENAICKANTTEIKPRKVIIKKESLHADADEILEAVEELDTPNSPSP